MTAMTMMCKQTFKKWLWARSLAQMDAAMNRRQALGRGAEEQLAASPKPRKARCPPELVVLARCRGCYKQPKHATKAAGPLEDQSSSSEEDDYELECEPPAVSANEHEGPRAKWQSEPPDSRTTGLQDGASPPTQVQHSPAEGASQNTDP